jgi:superoxide dismutase
VLFEYINKVFSFNTVQVFTVTTTEYNTKAVGAVWNILVRGKANSLEPKLKLFDTIATCVTLYSSHTWGLRYLDIIEQLQLHFLKRLLGINRAVHSYIIRLKTGRSCMKTLVMKQALLYKIKLLSMPRERYPLKCYLALNKRTI